jgi:hypothetical protein
MQCDKFCNMPRFTTHAITDTNMKTSGYSPTVFTAMEIQIFAP